MTLRVAQFSLKIAHLSFSMGSRGSRAYSLRPRLWLLLGRKKHATYRDKNGVSHARPRALFPASPISRPHASDIHQLENCAHVRSCLKIALCLQRRLFARARNRYQGNAWTNLYPSIR